MTSCETPAPRQAQRSDRSGQMPPKRLAEKLKLEPFDPNSLGDLHGQVTVARPLWGHADVFERWLAY